MVDDAAGSLDAYSVVAFSGVIPPSSKSEGSASSSAASSSASSNAAQDESPVQPEFTMQDAFAGSSDAAADESLRDSIESILEREDRRKASSDDGVYVSDVRDLYSLKGAGGLSLNLSDPARYAEPSVLNAGGKKLGVFSVSAYVSRAKLKSIETYLWEEGAEAIVCIAPRTSLLSTYDGLSVVILTTACEGRADERDKHGALVVESPEVGEVGVVIFSSNNVPSYKVVKEL